MLRNICFGLFLIVTAAACGGSDKNTEREPATHTPCSSRKDETACYGTDSVCSWDYMRGVCISSSPG
jgi:hypothetical protein